MIEKDFAQEIKKSIETSLRVCHYVKIPDAIYNPNASFNPEKHYDAYVVFKGCFTALEYKLETRKNAFAFSRVSLIQRSSLLNVVEAGAHAYIVVGYRCRDIRKAFFIPVQKFLEEEKALKRKSLALEYLETMFPQLFWLGHGIWQIDAKLFTY